MYVPYTLSAMLPDKTLAVDEVRRSVGQPWPLALTIFEVRGEAAGDVAGPLHGLSAQPVGRVGQPHQLIGVDVDMHGVELWVTAGNIHHIQPSKQDLVINKHRIAVFG